MHWFACHGVFTKKTINITSSPKTGDKTFEHMKEEIQELESHNKVTVICVVSDAAIEASKARRLLREWKPNLMTLDCKMGLTHTKLRNRLGFAKVTQLAQLRQELHRHREARKKKKMLATASASALASASTSASTSGRTRDLPSAQDRLMDFDALISADEFQLAVNEWFGDLDAEDRLAGMENFPAYQDSSAVVKTTLSSLFGSALMPILTEEAASSY